MDKLVIYTYNGAIALGIFKSLQVGISYLNNYKIILPFLGIFSIHTYINNKIYNPFVANLLLNTLHASLTSIGSILYINQYIPQHMYREILIISFTYFLYDMIQLIKGNSNLKNQLLFHHILLLLNLLGIFFESFKIMHNYYQLTSLLYLSEITNISLNLSYFSHETKNKKLLSYSLPHQQLYCLYHLEFFVQIMYGIYFIKILIILLCFQHLYLY